MELSMIAVLIGSGWLCLQYFNLQPELSLLYFVLLLIATIAVEVTHEGIHQLTYRLFGVDSEIEWIELSVLPYNQDVPYMVIVGSLIAPTIVVTAIAFIGILAQISELVTILSVYVLVLNTTLFTVDAFSLTKIVGEPLESRLRFTVSQEGPEIHRVHP
jgi:hypothetical protein